MIHVNETRVVFVPALGRGVSGGAVCRVELGGNGPGGVPWQRDGEEEMGRGAPLACQPTGSCGFFPPTGLLV